jgi:hypothetical protein
LKGENKRKEGELMPTKRARKTSKRTVIEPHKGHRRYVRRSKTDYFKKEVDVGRSLAADRRPNAKAKSQRRHADRGDTKRSVGVVKAVVRKPTGG